MPQIFFGSLGRVTPVKRCSKDTMWRLPEWSLRKRVMVFLLHLYLCNIFKATKMYSYCIIFFHLIMNIGDNIVSIKFKQFNKPLY